VEVAWLMLLAPNVRSPIGGLPKALHAPKAS
jgi:hypothetical protein